MTREKGAIKIAVILSFMHGLFFMTSLFLWIMWSHEDALFDQIVNKVITEEMDQREKALTLLGTTHDLLSYRNTLFQYQPHLGLKDKFFRSSDSHLMDSKGACGSHAQVLARLLQRANIPVRIAQMQDVDGQTCHVLVEAEIQERYVALDALYNLSFENDENQLMSFEEVGAAWNEISSTLPPDYDSSYNYQQVRYTNWEKIPFIMPLLRSAISVVIGDDVNYLSIRTFILNRYRFLGLITFTGYGLLIVISIFWYRKSIFYARKS